MTWIAISPSPPDFCGHPPCPKCFVWKGDDGQMLPGLARMALDLLGRETETSVERNQLRKIGDRIHKSGTAALISEKPENNGPGGATFETDIGMSSTQQLAGWFRERRREEPAKPRWMSLDEIVDRQNEREAAEKAKQKERNERLKEVREVAEVLASAQSRQSREEENYLRGVDPSFVSYMRQRGVSDPREIAYRWQREYGPSSYMVDPNSAIKPTEKYRW